MVAAATAIYRGMRRYKMAGGMALVLEEGAGAMMATRARGSLPRVGIVRSAAPAGWWWWWESWRSAGGRPPPKGRLSLPGAAAQEAAANGMEQPATVVGGGRKTLTIIL
jgi:hypothetical protein